MPQGEFHLELDAAAIAELGFDAETEDMLEDVGGQVADTARELAPKDTGEGADSIHGEAGVDDESAYVDVSWDRDHFYMGFHELGTEHQPARPFLRPALDSTKI